MLTCQYGLDEGSSLAILANLEYESNLDTKARQGHKVSKRIRSMSDSEWWSRVNSNKYGRGTGLAQWDGSRRYQLMDYAKRNKVNVYSLSTQISFMIFELTTYENRAFRKLKKEKNIYKKLYIFARYYERSGKLSISRRIKILNKYIKGGLGYGTGCN